MAEGREAEMFAWEGGRILRLLRNPDARSQVEWEAAAMKGAASCGVRVPAVFGTTDVMGRPGLIMERIDGTDLLTHIGRRPWGFVGAIRLTGKLHAKLHQMVAPVGVRDLRPTIRDRIKTHSRLPPHLARFAVDALDGLPDGDRLCHGDFHVANVIMEGETPVVIDWTGVARGDPTADVARTRIIYRVGEPPPGTALILYPLAAVVRWLLPGLYLGGYRSVRPVDMALLRRWETVRAADRVADGIPEERRALLRMLERRFRQER